MKTEKEVAELAKKIKGFRCVLKCKAIAERVRKETAEAVIAEILATLIVNNDENTEIFDYDDTIETIKEIAKKYGVEV